MNKPKILIGVDNHNWCWTQSMKSLAYYLPEYDIDIMSAYAFKKMKSYDEYDFAYLRGYANEFINQHNSGKMIPFISTLTTGGERLSRRMEEMKDKAGLGWAVIVQNKTAYHKCLEHDYTNVFLIPSGVNCNVYKPSENHAEIKYIGMAGNMRDGRALLKGKPFVEEACKKLYDNQDTVFYAETNIDKPLSYEQMVKFYQNLYIYAQPSDSEGCSNSVMEAMACGIPVLIVEGVGYHGEVCRDGIEHEDGEVIFVGRNSVDIENAIRHLLKNPDIYERISINARNFALNHDWKHLKGKYKKIFDEFMPIAKEQKERSSRVISEKIYKVDSLEDLAKTVDGIRKVTGAKQTTKNTIEIYQMITGLKNIH